MAMQRPLCGYLHLPLLLSLKSRHNCLAPVEFSGCDKCFEGSGNQSVMEDLQRKVECVDVSFEVMLLPYTLIVTNLSKQLEMMSYSVVNCRRTYETIFSQILDSYQFSLGSWYDQKAI
jgi:hypothetical protein